MKNNIISAIFLILFLGFISCEKEEPANTEVKQPVVELSTAKLEGGEFALDASQSKYVSNIKWECSGVIETPFWEDFKYASTKKITVPDTTKDYTVSVSVKNEFGEATKSKVLVGTHAELKGLELFISKAEIANAIAENEMDIYTGDDPIDLTGVYEVLRKENHKVKINGIVKDFEEESWFDYTFGYNWKTFLCNISESEILSSYQNGKYSRRVNYNIEGLGNKFTIYFEGEVNPWFTKLDGKNQLLDQSGYGYEDVGTEIGPGYHIVSGEIFEDGSMVLNFLWVAYEDGENYWSYNNFYVEPEKSDYETFTDPRDGRVYRIITIGNQTWFAENLKYEPTEEGYQFWPEGTDNDGDDKFYNWSEVSETSKESAGVAYTWTAATGYHVDSLVPSGEVVQGVCPEGWHIPTAAEWKELVDYLGIENAGTKLQSRAGKFPDVETVFGYYTSPTNESGFNFGVGCFVNGMYNENVPQIVGRAYLDSHEILTIGNSGEINYAIIGNFDGSSNYSKGIPGGPNWDGKYGAYTIRCIKDSE
ncbi:MAG: hypothetical protein KQH79_11390 [Bacteroidetes bacterium]|nr:hypothetical protein [Bacteroidota bacterium]